MTCDHNCFACLHEDCVFDEISGEEIREIEHREAMEKQMSAEQRAQRRYREKNKEKIASYYRKRYEERREELLAYQRKHYQAHREERLAWQRAYDSAHREQRRITDRKRREKKKAAKDAEASMTAHYTQQI